MSLFSLSSLCIVAGAVGLIVAGCAQPPDPIADRPPKPTGLIDEPDAAAWEPVAGERLLPLTPGVTHVRVTEGPGEGRTLAQRMEQAEDGHWLLTLDGRQRAYLRPSENGDVLVFREDDFEENVAVHYEPALVLVPAAVEADTVHEQEVEVTVRHLDSGDVRTRGTCAYRLEALGAGTITTPNGPQPAYVLRQDRQLNLGLARATIEIDTALVPDLGRVAWNVDRRTRALGLLGSQRQEGYAMIAADGEEEATPAGGASE